MRHVMPLLLLLACKGEDPIVPSDVTDIQGVCVRGDQFEVTFVGCLSSSCDTLVSSSCETSVDGSVTTITGTAHIESQGTECTDDCGFITARCPVPDVPYGDTDGADEARSFTFPGDTSGGTSLADGACTAP